MALMKYRCEQSRAWESVFSNAGSTVLGLTASYKFSIAVKPVGYNCLPVCIFS